MAGSLSFGQGVPAGDRPSRGTGRSTTAALTAARPKPKLSKVLPEIWKLVKPRKWLIGGSFLIMVVNRATSLVLPGSTKYLIDNVMNKGQLNLLPIIVGVVVAATILQGVTSYALTQLLSKAGQRLITDLRKQVQSHIGRLSVAFFDENRTGTLVARIMTDVEGVRNLIGTGILDFVGGVLTAIFAFCVLIRLSWQMTLLTFGVMTVFAFILQRAFKVIRPIFRERSKINAEVTGRLTESLGGVRVVKGYNAEESEAQVFANGAHRLLANVISSLTAQSMMSLASTSVLGVVGALIMYLGAHQVVAHKLSTGGYVQFVAFLAFMVAPIAVSSRLALSSPRHLPALTAPPRSWLSRRRMRTPCGRSSWAACTERCASTTLPSSTKRVNRCSTGLASTLSPARSRRWSAQAARANQRSSRLSAAFTMLPAERSRWTAWTSPRLS